ASAPFHGERRTTAASLLESVPARLGIVLYCSPSRAEKVLNIRGHSYGIIVTDDEGIRKIGNAGLPFASASALMTVGVIKPERVVVAVLILVNGLRISDVSIERWVVRGYGGEAFDIHRATGEFVGAGESALHRGEVARFEVVET